MINLLYSDLHRVLKGKVFSLGLALIFGYTFFVSLVLKLILMTIDANLTSDDVLTSFTTSAPFFIAASILFLFIGDFNDGTIRNKIMCGAPKRSVAASAIALGGMISAVFVIFSQISGIAIAKILTDGYEAMTAADIADFCLRNLIAAAAAGCFMTMILMILGGTKIAYVAGLVVTFLFRVATAQVADKLYPETGYTLLTGTKLQIYTLYDRYCPYSFFTGVNYHDLGKCLIGCIILILFSFAVGMIVYEKREFK